MSVTFNTEAFIAALEPPISTFVVQSFKDKLRLKMDKAIEEVWKECLEELPEQVDTMIQGAFKPYKDAVEVHVNLEIKE